MLNPAPRPPRQSFFEGPSTVFCVAVTACTVVINPSSMPKVSCTTFARGARQFVVQEAFEKMASPAYASVLTPHTNIGASGEGAETTTFFAPPFKCKLAFSLVRKAPVDSTT